MHLFQMGPGPGFGHLGFFVKFAATVVEDPWPRDRYITGAKCLTDVLDRALAGQNWIAGDCSIADTATCSWLRALDNCGA